MFSFAWPWLLALIPLPFLMRLLPKVASKPLAALHLPTFDLLSDSKHAEVKRGFPWVLFLAWCLLVTAAARPQWLGEPVTIPQEGRVIKK